MKKYNKSLIIVSLVSTTLFLATLIVCGLVEDRIKPYLLIPALLFAAVFPIYLFFGETIITAVCGWRNLNYCTHECFEKINKLVKGMKSSNLEFQEAVMYINHSYTDGEVYDYIKQNAIYSLYDRKDELLKKLSFYDDTTQIASSLFLSIMSSLLVMTIDQEYVIIKLIIFIGFFLMLIYVIFHKYSYRGQNGSYIHFLYEYEFKLLNEAIHSIENNLKAEPEIVPFIETRRNVLDVLYRKSIKAKRKTKPKIENDIAIVKQLKLEVEKNSCFILKEYEMIIDKKSAKCLTGKICVAYIVDENGIECFASDDFRMLYEIAAKYDLCVDIQ